MSYARDQRKAKELSDYRRRERNMRKRGIHIPRVTKEVFIDGKKARLLKRLFGGRG